jgi:hypothetical protein
MAADRALPIGSDPASTPTPCPRPARWRGVLVLLALLIAPPAFADVVSAKPNAVAVTVYRDTPASARSLRERGDGDASGLAMVSETRTVDLPAGRTRIRFEGVADEIIPASAALQGLPGALVERDFDYDLLDPASLIEKSVGGQVMLRRTNPKTGQVTEEPATLRSGPDGVVAETAEGVEALGCGAGPQALVFQHQPEGLADRPTLSVVADAPVAGRYTLTLSYLSVAIDWSADYVARIAPDGKTLDLTGWLTLSNRSGMSFADAPTSVVAGHLARVAPDLPDISPKTVSAECWPMGTTSDIRATNGVERLEGVVTVEPPPAPPPPMMEMAAAPMGGMARRVIVTTLGDYKLYSLEEPTTLAARETKQIRFLHQAGVAFETLYVWRADDVEAGEPTAPSAAAVLLSFENKTDHGLGLPLPAGLVSIRQPQADAGGRELFVGEQGLRDVPLDEPFELQTGEASDVTVSQRVASDATTGSGSRRRERVALEFAVTNAKPVPVTFELRQKPPETAGFAIVTESTPHVLKNGDNVWRVTLPAGGAITVSYAFEVPA